MKNQIIIPAKYLNNNMKTKLINNAKTDDPIMS